MRRRQSNILAWGTCATWAPIAALAATIGVASSACQSGGGVAGAPSTFSLGTARAVTTSADVTAPYDAAPSPDGHTIYFTANGAQGAAVYQGSPGGAASVLFAGAPLVFPAAVAVSDDGAHLFVADPAAEPAPGVVGGIYTIALPGGQPSLVAGSGGFIAAGLEVAAGKLYAAGASSTGIAGLYVADTAGGALTPLATGSPFVDPSGIAVRSASEVYVADDGGGSARVIRVLGGVTTVLVRDLAVGYPAGLALSPDQSALFVSALDPNAGGDSVLRVGLASAHVDSTSTGIAQFADPAGLHRARNVPVYAWADATANGSGCVLVFGSVL